MAFAIDFSPEAREHLKALRKRDQQILVDAIAEQLTHQPDMATPRRKQLEDNPLAPWELRAGDYQVFYDVSRESDLVIVVAVGQKDHNTLRIGGEEIEL